MKNKFINFHIFGIKNNTYKHVNAVKKKIY